MKKLIKLSAIILFIVAAAIIFQEQLFSGASTKVKDSVIVNNYRQLEQALKSVDEKSLVVYDVDDVLITAPDIFARGHEFPFELRAKIIFNQPQLIFSRNWEEIYSLIWQLAPRHLVDHNAPKLIAKLQKQQIPIILLTSMESGAYGAINDFPAWRYNMLKSFNIDLSEQFADQELTKLPKYRGYYPKFFKGILCANQQDKGLVLKEFIRLNNIKPTKIFFIDDSATNLTAVGKACNDMNINYKLIHFKAVDYEPVNIQVALQQIDNLVKNKSWQSDYDLSGDKFSPTQYNYDLDKAVHEIIGDEPPYTAMFSTSNTKILFVAPKHSSDMASQGFKLIHSAITNFRPNLIIVEGIESKLGISSPEIIAYMQQECRNKDKWECGENLYAVNIAQQNSLAFLGGEPDDQEILKYLISLGYGSNDIEFFYFTRKVPQLYRENKVHNLPDIEKQFYKYNRSFFAQNKVDFQQYKNWLSKHQQKFDFATFIDAGSSAPVASGKFIQKISAEIGYKRDQYLLNLIADSAKKYDKIMVVYGASRFSILYEPLVKMFGPAIFATNGAEGVN